MGSEDTGATKLLTHRNRSMVAKHSCWIASSRAGVWSLVVEVSSERGMSRSEPII